MKKMFQKLLIPSVVLSMALPMTASAGWEQNSIGWWYTHPDGTYTTNNWEQVDGRWYYFDRSGYMLHDTSTPDGFWVGSDGAWVESVVIGQTAVSGPAGNGQINPGNASEYRRLNSTSQKSSYQSNATSKKKSYKSTKKRKEEKEKNAEEKAESKYESIYKKYKKKLQKCDGSIEDLAEIQVEGTEKMADVWLKNGGKYKVYEDWAMKLYAVYEKEAKKRF